MQLKREECTLSLWRHPPRWNADDYLNMEGYSFDQLFSIVYWYVTCTLSVFCSFIIALFLHIFHILSLILYYIPAICNIIWRGQYSTHLCFREGQMSAYFFFGRRKCLPTLFQGGVNVRSSFFREGKCPTPRFREGRMSEGNFRGGQMS